MRPRVKSIVDEMKLLLAWTNEVGTLVVNLTASVSHAEDAQVHLLVVCGCAVAAPIGSWKNSCCSIRNSSAANTSEGQVHVDAGRRHLLSEATWALGPGPVHVYRMVAIQQDRLLLLVVELGREEV